MTSGLPRVVLRTALGDILIELQTDRTPASCADFLRRVDEGLFANTSFYRVVTSQTDPVEPAISIVQGGVMNPEPSPGIVHEPTCRTGISHRDETVSIARAAPGTGSAAAFFICVGDQPELDAGGRRQTDGLGFAAFARVVDGMDIVRAIQRRPTRTEGPVPGRLDGQMLAEPVPIVAAERHGQ